MKYKDFQSNIQSAILPAYLICGEEGFYKEQCTQLLKGYVCQPAFDCVRFEGESVRQDYSKMLSALFAYPMLGDKRLIIVDEFYPTENECKKHLQGYLDNPQPTSILLIRNNKQSDSLSALNGLCSVQLNKPESIDATDEIIAQALSKGKNITNRAALKLSAYCLNDMTRISGEINKLVDFVGDKNEIDVDDVAEIVSADTEYKLYEMTDAISVKNTEKAMEIINDLLDKNESLQRLYVSVYNYFRRLFFVAISNESDGELAKKFGVKEFAIKKTKERAKYFKKTALKDVIVYISENDGAFKSGKITAYSAFFNTIFNILNK